MFSNRSSCLQPWHLQIYLPQICQQVLIKIQTRLHLSSLRISWLAELRTYSFTWHTRFAAIWLIFYKIIIHEAQPSTLCSSSSDELLLVSLKHHGVVLTLCLCPFCTLVSFNPFHLVNPVRKVRDHFFQDTSPD